VKNKMKLSEKYEPLFEWLGAEIDSPLFSVNTVLITGGRYSQKSFAVGTFSGVATKDFNHRILYTRYTLTSAEDSIIPEFVEKLSVLNCEDQFEVKKDRINGKYNNSKVVFKGIKTSSGNQTASLKSLKDFSIFISEEAEEYPKFEEWDKIKKSIRALDVRNLSILMLNPTTKEHWIYEKLFEDLGVQEGFNGIIGNVLYIHSTYLDIEREFITDDIWAEYEELRVIYEHYENYYDKSNYDFRLKRKALYFKHSVLGGWLDKAEGVIYTNWKTGDFQEIAEPLYGQDFGFSNDPTTLIKVSIDKKNKVIYAHECFYKTRLTTSQIFDLNKIYAENSLIYGDSAEPRLIEELNQRGNNIKPVEKGAGSISAGIALLQDYQIIVSSKSINMIKELNNYAWSDKASNTPIDKHNHTLDSLRYATYQSLKTFTSSNLQSIANLL
jgi:phage terminase large subunit